LLLTASSAASSSAFENRRSKVISTGQNSRRARGRHQRAVESVAVKHRADVGTIKLFPLPIL
jgi:hypothetical protein